MGRKLNRNNMININLTWYSSNWNYSFVWRLDSIL